MTQTQDIAPLFEKIALGPQSIKNRIWMAPITRNRARPDGTPGELASLYYSQRASAGLIISEATQISPSAIGYINTPGIYEDAHVAGWREVTGAVHGQGGRIFSQLWHVGRVSHHSLLPNGVKPLAPSAIHADMTTFTHRGFERVSPPREATIDDINEVIADYRRAARNAILTGFDGVEIHAGNGYLLDEFLHVGANRRTDQYGGSETNRIRLVLEVLEAVGDEIGISRVGLRLSPTGTFGDVSRHGSETTFVRLYEALNDLDLAYLHVVHKFMIDRILPEDEIWLDDLRSLWRGRYIANGDFSKESAAHWIREGKAHAVTFGKPFISNPDLPERFAHKAELNSWDSETFYGGDHRGYVDYPTLADQREAA